MIRTLRIFAWLRWRLLLNGLRGSKRRDALERISRVLAVLAPALLVLPFGTAALLLAVLGFHAGRSLGIAGNEARTALFVARLVLFLVLLLPILVPLGRAAQTSRAGFARVLLLPIPRSTIHLAETIASLADPWLGFVVPGLACFAAGLLSAGRSEDALVALAAMLGVLAAVASLNALASFATDWIMRERRRGENFTFLLVVALSVAGLVPALFASRFEGRARIPDGELRSEARSPGKREHGKPADEALERESEPDELGSVMPDRAGRGQAAHERETSGRERIGRKPLEPDAREGEEGPTGERGRARSGRPSTEDASPGGSIPPNRRRRHQEFSVEDFDAKLPAWTRALPSELYASAVQAQVDGRSEKAWLLLAGLFAEAAALYTLSSAVHRRVLGTSASGRGRRRATEVIPHSRRWPGLTPGATAVAVVHARNALRSVRGRLAVFLPGPLFAFLSLLGRRIPGEIPFDGLAAGGTHALLGFQCLFALYALQAFHLNQFGSDRAGLSLHFLSPISDLELVKGKAAGGAVIYLASVAVCVLCALVVSPAPPDLAWVAVLLSAAATYALMAPGAAALSALFPKTADLSRTGSGGNPHGLAVLLGTLAMSALAGPPWILLGVVRDRLDDEGLALGLVAAWTVLAVAVSLPLLRLVSTLVGSRRENLALVANGR